MSDPKINLKVSGWYALVGIAVVAVLLGGRIATMDDMSGNKNLMDKVEFELMTEYFPDDVDEMKSLLASGDMEQLGKKVKSTASTKINVRSVKASYSIFDFSTHDRDVVVKVDYALTDAYGTRREGTKYYLFEYKPLINGWRCIGDSFKWRYYSNFI
jgi:hypothetical protein